MEVVNQTMKDLEIDNSTKLSSAIISARNLAEKVGIKLTDSQWETIIESSVIEIKKGLNTLAPESIITPENTPVINHNDTTSMIATVEELPSLEGQNSDVLQNVKSAESIAVPSVESIPEIIPETQNIPDLTIGDVVLTDNSPISTIPIVVDTVNNAITDQIKLLAQQTANTTITNIVNQAINDALIKATTPVG